jgi:membrane protease YdiL (CAAX protease family)
LKQLLKSLRSVLPTDLTQLIFLGGLVCLTIGPRLRWWPEISANAASIDSLFPQARIELGHYVLISSSLFWLATAAGYFFCFWPGRHPLCKILWWVLLPAIVAVGLICGRYISLTSSQISVFLRAGGETPSSLSATVEAMWNLGSGLHVCILGLLLIAIYAFRLRAGYTSLPLALSIGGTSLPEDDDSWRRTRALTWFLVSPLGLLASAIPVLLVMEIVTQAIRFADANRYFWSSLITTVPSSLTLCVMALLISGEEGWSETRRALTLCEPSYVALGALFPTGIDVALSVGQYLYDRAYWAAHFFLLTGPPRFGDYFRFPFPSFLWMVFDPFAEEIIFRGILQPRLIRRYGTSRGIFFVGIAWSAMHFFADFNSRFSGWAALQGLCFRIILCLTLSYVLGWLTLRFGSILPAVVAHTLFNILVFSPIGPDFPGKQSVRIALWAVLAYVLYHYWPLQTGEVAQVLPAEPSEV